MDISKSVFSGASLPGLIAVTVSFKISDTHEHPGDRGGYAGGYAGETHSFRVVGGSVRHDYDVNVDEPECYNICTSDGCLPTKDEALSFVKGVRESLEEDIANLKELEELLQKLDYVEDYADDVEDDSPSSIEDEWAEFRRLVAREVMEDGFGPFQGRG